MRAFLTSHVAVSIHLVVFAVSIVLASSIVAIQKASLTEELTNSLDERIDIIRELAELTGKNGADDVITTIVQDCSRRSDFDYLIGNLGTLGPKELLDVQQLYDSCSGFYVERKALMVARLQQEFDNALREKQQLSKLTDTYAYDVILMKWSELIELEVTRSSYLSEQTLIQANIITALISKNKDVEIRELSLRGYEIAQLLMVIEQQISTLREGLST